MKDLIYYSALFDYYQNLLTDTQKEYFKDYYFNNLTLSEIADNYNVTRNAISKTLKEVKEKLDYYEEKLHLYRNKQKISKLLGDDILAVIEDYI